MKKLSINIFAIIGVVFALTSASTPAPKYDHIRDGVYVFSSYFISEYNLPNSMYFEHPAHVENFWEIWGCTLYEFDNPPTWVNLIVHNKTGTDLPYTDFCYNPTDFVCLIQLEFDYNAVPWRIIDYLVGEFYEEQQ